MQGATLTALERDAVDLLKRGSPLRRLEATCCFVKGLGAQAIYLHTGDADFAVAEYTTDADFCVAPKALTDAPLLPGLLEAQGFLPGEHPGAWLSPDGITVDLMVPEALAGPSSRRGARLGPHGKRAARRAKGLEGAIVDRKLTTIFRVKPAEVANRECFDGWFADGPLAGKTVNVKWYGKRTVVLDINPRGVPDYYLAMTGQRAAGRERAGPDPAVGDHGGVPVRCAGAGGAVTRGWAPRASPPTFGNTSGRPRGSIRRWRAT